MKICGSCILYSYARKKGFWFITVNVADSKGEASTFFTVKAGNIFREKNPCATGTKPAERV